MIWWVLTLPELGETADLQQSILFDTITLAPGLKAFQIMPIEDGPELRPQNAMSGMQEVLNRRKELHLKILGVRFQQVYQFLRDEEGVVKGERLSLGFWEGGLNSKLFCSKLTEW